jgi:hypothetical protein
MDRQDIPPPKPGRISREEYEKLVQGVDDIYFGGKDQVSDEDDHTGRYTQFKAHQWGISATEAGERSLARLFSELLPTENVVVVLTAFRHGETLAKNRLSNAALRADIRQLGWGYTPVSGCYLDAEKQGEKKVGLEEAVIATSSESPKRVIAATLKLLTSYQQPAALVKMPDNLVLLLYADGRTESQGDWPADPQQIAQTYALMRGIPPGRQFRFEAAGDDSVMTRFAVDVYFKSQMNQQE